MRLLILSIVTVLVMMGAVWSERASAGMLIQNVREVLLGAGEHAHVECTGPGLNVTRPSDTTAELECSPFPPTATPTLTPTLVPTPTSTPAPVLVEGVPLCTDHDIVLWHPLVKRDNIGTILCTYTHEHHDDPNTVADIFGPPGGWFGAIGQSISYPWQTFAFPQTGVRYPLPQPPAEREGLENIAKHFGYKWYVKRDLPCIPFGAPPNDGCFRAYRVQVHSAGHVGDATARFHSFSLEAVVDYHGQQGIVRGGGWMDTGFLGLLVDGGRRMLCPSLATNPPGFVCPSTGTSGNHRDAGSVNVPAPHTAHANPGSSVGWYATHRGAIQAQPTVEDFGPIDYTDPHRQHFYPPQYRANNSLGRVENMAVVTLHSWLNPYKDASGRITARLYLNRHGDPVTGCTAPGLDCVPVVVDGAPAARYLMNANTNPAVFRHADHDVLSPVTGNSLITYPN